MQKMMIITADNDVAEVLSLRFELEGFSVERAHPSGLASSKRRTRKPAMCIIDVAGMKPEELENAQNAIEQLHLGTFDAIFLIHEAPEGKTYPSLHRHIIMKKPYDLTMLTRMVSKLIAQKEKNKKPRPSKR